MFLLSAVLDNKVTRILHWWYIYHGSIDKIRPARKFLVDRKVEEVRIRTVSASIDDVYGLCKPGT